MSIVFVYILFLSTVKWKSSDGIDGGRLPCTDVNRFQETSNLEQVLGIAAARALAITVAEAVIGYGCGYSSALLVFVALVTETSIMVTLVCIGVRCILQISLVLYRGFIA